jgi:hypothetical protein
MRLEELSGIQALGRLPGTLNIQQAAVSLPSGALKGYWPRMLLLLFLRIIVTPTNGGMEMVYLPGSSPSMNWILQLAKWEAMHATNTGVPDKQSF